MSKLILLFVILLSIILPIVMGGRPAPRRTLRTLQMTMVVVIVAWGYMCMSWYPQIVPLD